MAWTDPCVRQDHRLDEDCNVCGGESRKSSPQLCTADSLGQLFPEFNGNLGPKGESCKHFLCEPFEMVRAQPQHEGHECGHLKHKCRLVDTEVAETGFKTGEAGSPLRIP